MTLPRLLRTFAVAIAAVALAFTASGCSGSAQGSHGYITGPGTVLTIDPADRKDVPDVSGETLGGSTLDVADYRGQVVVLNIWASWCPPCRAEADELNEAYDQLPDAAFIGIDTNEDSRSAAEAFVREHPPRYDSIYDEDGALMLAFYGMLRPDSLPSTLVLDQQGRIAALVLGPTTTGTIVGLVEDVENESES